MFPPAALSLPQGVTVLDKQDVINSITAFHKDQTTVLGGNGVHHILQVGAAGTEVVAPSQSRIGPVDNKDDVERTFTYPIGNVVCTDSGIRGGVIRVRHWIDGSWVSVCIEPAPTIIISAVHNHTAGGVCPTTEITVVERGAHACRHITVH